MMYCTAGMSYVNAIFLDAYPLKYLSYFYLSAALFFIAVSHFSAPYFSKHHKPSLAIALSSATIIITGAWWWSDYIRLSTWYPFVFCVFLLASGKILIQIYWNTAGRLLHIREFKNSSNILGAAIAIGGIIMGLLGPAIIAKYRVTGLLPTIDIFLLINLAMLPYSISVDPATLQTATATPQRFHRQNSLQKLLMYFALVTLIFSTLVDYMFKHQVAASFGPEKIAIYTSKIFALSYTLTLLVELFYIKKILQRFGLSTFILQVPILLIAITLAVVFKTNLITISILMVAYTVLNLSVLDVSFQLLGNALPEQSRGVNKLKSKGIGLFLGSLISSGIVFFLSNRTSLMAIGLCFIASMIIFIVLTRRTVKAYDQSLEHNLKEHHILNMDEFSLTENTVQWNETVQKCFDSKDASVKLIGYELLSKKNPIPNEILDRVSEDLQDNNSFIRIEAAKVLSLHMNETYFNALSKRLKDENDAEVIWWIFQSFLTWRQEDVLDIAKKYVDSTEELVQAGRIAILIKFGDIMDVIVALSRLVTMINSPDPLIRMTATRVLSLFDLQSAVKSLSGLIIDPDIHVSIMAIQSTIEHSKKEYVPSLMHQMGVKNVAYYASKAIFTFGVEIIPVLVESINHVNNPVFHRTAIRCIANIEGGIAEKALAQLMTYDSTLIRNNTMKAIAYRSLTTEFTEEFLHAIKKQLQEEKSRITYYKQLLSLELTVFERQEIKALIYSAVYRVLYLFSIDAPQKLMPIVSLILDAMVQSNFSNLFQEKVELLDIYLRDSRNRLFLLQLFDESTIASVNAANLLSADKLGPWLSTVFSVKSLAHENAHMHDLEKLVILRGCDLFKNLPADLLLILADRLDVLLIAKETTLFKEGELPGDLYIVAEGEVNIMHDTQLISSKKKFDFIGELSILDDKPRTATAVAAMDAVVLKMSRIEYDRILDDFPDMLRTISQTLLGYLRQYQN